MPEHQTDLPLDAAFNLKPQAPPELRDEIARIWGLPLGRRVEITFRPAFPLASTVGILELRSAPDLPWNPHQPLALRVAGCDFTTRNIERWKLVMKP